MSVVNPRHKWNLHYTSSEHPEEKKREKKVSLKPEATFYRPPWDMSDELFSSSVSYSPQQREREGVGGCPSQRGGQGIKPASHDATSLQWDRWSIKLSGCPQQLIFISVRTFFKIFIADEIFSQNIVIIFYQNQIQPSAGMFRSTYLCHARRSLAPRWTDEA